NIEVTLLLYSFAMSRVDVKVVLLGKEFGGKTSLVERYVHRRFSEKSMNKYQATIGAAFASKKVVVDSGNVTLGIWDTAGSERYEAMSRMYYRNARAAIVCFDLTDATSFERCKFWIHELIQQEESCKLYLCGTKRDLIEADPSKRMVSEKAIADYATLVNAQVFETSSKTGENVDQLFFNIVMDYVQFEMQLEDNSSNLNIGKISHSNFYSTENTRHNSFQESRRRTCCF
ncbi:ras-related protein Rab-24-like isoform X2, partial [Leptotrombidium deliense]